MISICAQDKASVGEKPHCFRVILTGLRQFSGILIFRRPAWRTVTPRVYSWSGANMSASLAQYVGYLRKQSHHEASPYSGR